MFPLFDSLTIYSFWFLSKQSVDCVIISSVLSLSFYSSICSALLHVARLFKLYNRHRNGFLAAWLDKRKQGKKKEKKQSVWLLAVTGCSRCLIWCNLSPVEVKWRANKIQNQTARISNCVCVCCLVMEKTRRWCICLIYLHRPKFCNLIWHN